MAHGPEHLPDPGPPGGADAAGTDLDDVCAVRAGHRRGPVGARVRHHHHVHGDADLPGRPADSGEAGRQQVLLVVRGDHDPRRLDHTSPSAWATETGLAIAPEVDLGEEIRFGVIGEPGEPGAAAQGRVHVVTAARVFGDRVPPVHREEGAGRPERREREVEDVVQVGTGEVVQELRENDQVESARAASHRGWPGARP